MDTPQLVQKRTIITFIGAGNMARSLIMGLVNYDSSLHIRVTDPDPQQLTAVKQCWQAVETYTADCNSEAVQDATVVVLAVKPQVMPEVVEGLVSACQRHRPLVISIAAGIPVSSLQRWLGDNSLPIVRCMPNTPALVQTGATGLFANSAVSKEQHNLAESIMRAVGVTLWFKDEHLLDVVTATSGSGPAYFFLIMEAMQAAAEQLGLSATEARLLVTQTALGAAKLALEGNDSVAELRQKVTSKGGTTAAALDVFNAGNFNALVLQAMTAATERAKQLAALYE